MLTVVSYFPPSTFSSFSTIFIFPKYPFFFVQFHRNPFNSLFPIAIFFSPIFFKIVKTTPPSSVTFFFFSLFPPFCSSSYPPCGIPRCKESRSARPACREYPAGDNIGNSLPQPPARGPLLSEGRESNFTPARLFLFPSPRELLISLPRANEIPRVQGTYLYTYICFQREKGTKKRGSAGSLISYS